MREKYMLNTYQESFDLPNVVDAADKLFDIVKNENDY